MAVVFGKNFMLYVVRQGVKVPVCYSESVTLTFTGELLEATKALSTVWRSFYIGMLDYSIDCNGVVWDDENSTYNLGSMLDSFMKRESVKWICQDDTNTLVQYSGSILYPSLSIDSAAGDINRFNLSAKGDGNFVKTVVIPGASGLIYYFTQDDNETPEEFPLFITADPNQDIIIPYGVVTGGKYYGVAYTSGAQTKLAYEDQSDTNNKGSIGGATDLFETRQILIGGNPFIMHITRYLTAFGGTNQAVKFLIPANAVQLEPPTGLTATFENIDDDTAHLDYSFTASTDPAVTGYTLRIINVTNPDTDYYDLDTTETTGSIVVLRGAKYLVSVRSVAGSVTSGWRPDVEVNIPAHDSIQNIIITGQFVGLPYGVVINASAIVNTNVQVTFESGVPGSRTTSIVTIISGTSSMTKYMSPIDGTNVVITAVSPTTFGNQNYTF